MKIRAATIIFLICVVLAGICLAGCDSVDDAIDEVKDKIDEISEDETPSPSASPESTAAVSLADRVYELAYGQLNQTRGVGAFADAGLVWVDESYTYCDRFVSAVMTVALGRPLADREGFLTAIEDYEAHRHLINQGDPPKGAIVYYDRKPINSNCGHVGISDGERNLISVVDHRGVLRASLDAMAAPQLGWIHPEQYYSSGAVELLTLTLYVHDGSASGPVVSGAQVTGQDASGSSFSQITNSNGYVTITGTPGDWQFSISQSGYQANTWSQGITATGTKHAFFLNPEPVSGVTLILYVHDGSASGPVVSGAQVTGQDASGNSFNQITDSSGYVTITGTPGTWQFSISQSDYQTNTWSQGITATGTKHAYLFR
ncbi:MAG: hypothetical protein PHV74_14290 [Dehalococcoidia bacterium]|nr:hypothetical protein [Dehalococcoidia bacterium]